MTTTELPLIGDDVEPLHLRDDVAMDRRPTFSPMQSRLLLAMTWLCVGALIAFYAVRITRIGIDLRNDFWVYWENNRFYPDINSAMVHGLHVLGEASEVEQEDRDKETPAQQAADDQRLARGEFSTIAQPGPGLLDSPRSLTTFFQRWHRLKPVYSHIFRGWVQTYDHLQRDRPDGEYGMDYPPLRCLVMTLWSWKVQSEHPGINHFPRGIEQQLNAATGRMENLTPELAHPLLMLNMFFEGVSSIAMFFLVWIWMEKRTILFSGMSWRSRWGDPILLAPVTCLIFFSLLRAHIAFNWAPTQHLFPSLIDDRITNLGWWIFLVLRFVSVVALAHFLPRPFRGVLCGLVAATLVWLNPAAILDSFGWPQWEAWVPPFFLIAAVLVSLDWWLTAGLVLAVGVMFKGQLLFISPVLILCPLFAGWFGRFLRIAVGLTTGMGLIVWPWLVNGPSARTYIGAAVYAAALVCVLTVFQKHIWRGLQRFTQATAERARTRWIGGPVDRPDFASETRYHFWIAVVLALITATWLSLLIYHHQNPAYKPWTVLLTLAILTVPWFIPRHFIACWLTLVFSASLWLTAASLNGSFSWWNVGFLYGTKKHQSMQLGQDSLSNLTSLLENRYRWTLHDPVGTLHLPFVSDPIDLDVQVALVVVFGLTLILCAVAAAIHLRRNDEKFLIAIAAPWVLFVTLLTQMAARYMSMAAVVSAVVICISTSMSLLQLLVTMVACVMLGNQRLAPFPNTAPVTYSITQPTFPDAGWMLLLLAAVFVCTAIAPTKRST